MCATCFGLKHGASSGMSTQKQYKGRYNKNIFLFKLVLYLTLCGVCVDMPEDTLNADRNM
jgi:hypothetical protein